MPSVKKRLLEILPNLKIVILHSKIDAQTTEDEIAKFIAGEYDLMLCTSIVESGIHMPRVNTILIDNADKFGIADLHQLRGRVRGRGSGPAAAGGRADVDVPGPPAGGRAAGESAGSFDLAALL